MNYSVLSGTRVGSTLLVDILSKSLNITNLGEYFKSKKNIINYNNSLNNINFVVKVLLYKQHHINESIIDNMYKKSKLILLERKNNLDTILSSIIGRYFSTDDPEARPGNSRTILSKEKKNSLRKNYFFRTY